MAFDACMLRAVLWDITTRMPDAKIEKVLAPQNDEIDLLLHSGRNNMRLVFNVGPNAPRIGLSAVAKENPKTPPMLCMLLRKRLAGARLKRVEQIGFDRIARFTFSCYDEMGFTVELSLIGEIMGKYANLILTDGEDKIITAMKMIDFSASSVRQVLPGLRYTVPDDMGRRSPLIVDRDFFFEKLSLFPEGRTFEKFITSTYSGIATQIAHELTYRATGMIDIPLCDIPDREKLYEVFSAWQTLLLNHDYTPTVAVDPSGKPKDYSYMDITYLGNSHTVSHRDTFSELFDFYFAERDRLERIHQRASDLIRLVTNAISRTEKKIELQRQALLESEKGEEYKRIGDIITANLYQLKRGMGEIDLVDYYDENCPTVHITLDTRLSPSQNAQRYYKLYNKAKNAKTILSERILEWEEELLYLESVYDFLLRATCEQDMIDIRDELYRSGYASRMRGYAPSKVSKSKPIEYTTSGGYRLLVGRNNTQNDYLTFKVATKGDLWFHVKDMPGSHCILLCDGEEPSETDYTEAASVSAYHSKATTAPVAVDYTRVKNIRKPAGAKPGYVIYKTNYTAFVSPTCEIGRKEEENG